MAVKITLELDDQTDAGWDSFIAQSQDASDELSKANDRLDALLKARKEFADATIPALEEEIKKEKEVVEQLENKRDAINDLKNLEKKRARDAFRSGVDQIKSESDITTAIKQREHALKAIAASGDRSVAGGRRSSQLIQEINTLEARRLAILKSQEDELRRQVADEIARDKAAQQSLAKLRQRQAAEAKGGQGGLPLGGIAAIGAAFLTVEKGIQLATQAVAGVVSGVTKAADEAERLGESSGEIGVLAKQFKAVELITAEIARNIGKGDDAISDTATIIARTVAGYQELKSEILTGKNLSQLDNEQKLRMQRILVRDIEEEFKNRNQATAIQRSSEKELLFIKQRSLRILKAMPFEDRNRLLHLKDIQLVNQEIHRREQAALERRKAGLQAIRDLQRAIADEQRGRQKTAAERQRELAISEREQRAAALTQSERLAETQADKDKAQIDSATRLRDVQQEQQRQIDKGIAADQFRLKMLRDTLRGQVDQVKARKDILDIEKDLTKRTEERNKITDKIRETQKKLDDARKTAADNRIRKQREEMRLERERHKEWLANNAKETEAAIVAFRQRRAAQIEADARQVQQRGLVGRAAQRLDPRAVIQQIAAERGQQLGTTASAQLARVRRDLQRGRISRGEIAKAQASLLHEAAQTALSQGKINQKMADAFQKAVSVQLKAQQSQEQMQQELDNLTKRIDQLTNTQNTSTKRFNAQRRNNG